MTITATTKQLTHGQLVRGKGFSPYAQMIEVATLDGYFRHDVLRYGKAETFDELNARVAGQVAQSVKRDEEMHRPTQWAWTLQHAACLTADYPGKARDIANERAKIAAAPELEDGEVVEIDGALYSVKLMGDRYSDPIHFTKI